MLGRDHLEHRFNSLWARVGAVGDPLPVLQDIVWRYGEADRAYHVINHIAQGFEEFDAVKGNLRNTEALEFAWWLHDVIYDSHVRTNEEESAEYARMVMTRARINSDIVEMAGTLILNTKHDVVPTSPAGQLLVDIDLSILGKPAAAFNKYEEQIRFEYLWVPTEAYRDGRTRLLKSFLDRKTIYNTPLFISMYEDQARKNLKRSIRKLRP